MKSFFNYSPIYKSYYCFLRTLLRISYCKALLSVITWNFKITCRKNCNIFSSSFSDTLLWITVISMLFCLPYCSIILILVSRKITLLERSEICFYGGVHMKKADPAIWAIPLCWNLASVNKTSWKLNCIDMSIELACFIKILFLLTEILVKWFCNKRFWLSWFMWFCSDQTFCCLKNYKK